MVSSISAAATSPLPITRLEDAAVKLEAQFLSTLLKEAGLGPDSSGFSGGAGEDQFSSFLVEAQALHIAKSGGIGLAEMFFETLKDGENAK